MSKSNERWLTLDVLKAIFLVLMIIGHNMVWWFFEQDAYLAQPSFFVTRWVIPYIQINSYLMLMFPIVAGVALAYQNEKRDFSDLLKRGLFVMALGFLINYKSWDVLQLIGVSIIWISLISKNKKLIAIEKPVLAITAAAAVFAAPALFQRYGHSSTFWKEILFGTQNETIFFPIFPWLGGIIFGYLFEKTRRKNDSNLRFWLFAVGAGLICVMNSGLAGTLVIPINTNNVWGPSIFSPPTSRVFAHLGMFLIVTSLFEFLIQTNRLPNLCRSKIVSLFSKHILYIYTAHQIFGERFVEYLKSFREPLLLLLAISVQLIAAFGIAYVLEYLKFQTKLKSRITWI